MEARRKCSETLTDKPRHPTRGRRRRPRKPRQVPIRDQPSIIRSFRRIRARLNPDPDPVVEARREQTRLDTWACFDKLWREAALKSERRWQVEYSRYELRGLPWDQLLADDPDEWVRMRGNYLFCDDPMSEAERVMWHHEYDPEF